jgi:transcriptional regulator with XRE-family HTH domain
MTVKERLIEYIKYKGISIRLFCRTSGLSESYVTSIRSSIQPDKLDMIAQHFPDLNIGWVVTGEGSMIKVSSQLPSIDREILIQAGAEIFKDNLIETSIYLAVRLCVKATWINDRDQFLFPNEGWTIDQEFQNNCFTFTLFSHNYIKSDDGVNHWIPFTEHEVNSREKFESNFMTSFISGKLNHKPKVNLFETKESRKDPLEFSPEAQNVFNAGRMLWSYYHAQPKCNVNATLYDIREYFQCRNDKGVMKSRSEDETYMELITNLRNKLKLLQIKIEPKVYEYGFLK